jgi:type IX secretion system PorP/SprF family membrane protein
MKRIPILFFLAQLGWFAAEGQQHATFSQYMFNGLAINPGYAGSQEAMTANLLSRFQNVGLPGAPNTQSFSIHTPLMNAKIALGLLVVHDKLSVISQTGVNGIYAYRLPLNNKATLSMGLQMGFSSYRADYTELDIYQPDIF